MTVQTCQQLLDFLPKSYIIYSKLSGILILQIINILSLSYKYLYRLHVEFVFDHHFIYWIFSVATVFVLNVCSSIFIVVWKLTWVVWKHSFTSLQHIFRFATDSICSHFPFYFCLNWVHKDDPLFRRTKIKSWDFDYVLSWSSTHMFNILQSINLILFLPDQRDDWFDQFTWVSFI